MRADEIIKKDYYINQIMNDFKLKAKYPSAIELEEALNAINLMESVFKVAPVADGYLFEDRTHNGQIEGLDFDLRTLYQLLKKYTKDEYDKLSMYADTKLNELEKKTDFYLAKSKLEMQSSSLGRTALFLRAPFTGEQLGEYFNIDCDSVSLTNGSFIHLLLEGNNINYARLKLDNGTDTFYVTPYQLNMQSFKVPGDLLENEIEVEVPNAPKTDESIYLPYKPDKECEYVVLAGKGQLSAKTNIKSDYKPFAHYACYEDTMIDFYVKDATSIQIRTSARPLSSNYDFTKEVIKLEKGIKHFYLKMPAKSAVEIFVEGGEVYAQKAKAVVKSDKMYFVHNTPFKKFLIIEKSRANKTEFKASLEVKSTIESLGVHSVMIKELIK